MKIYTFWIYYRRSMQDILGNNPVHETLNLYRDGYVATKRIKGFESSGFVKLNDGTKLKLGEWRKFLAPDKIIDLTQRLYQSLKDNKYNIKSSEFDYNLIVRFNGGEKKLFCCENEIPPQIIDLNKELSDIFKEVELW